MRRPRTGRATPSTRAREAGGYDPSSPIDFGGVDPELRHHLEERVDQLVAAGMSGERARRVALAELGDIDRIEAELRRIRARRGRRRRWAPLAGIRQDTVIAARQLVREPAFALLAVGTLAIGIAAATTIFGLVKAVVLDPLPYPDPDRLVSIAMVTPDGQPFSVSVPDFADLREGLDAVEGLAAARWMDVTVGVERPVRLVAAQATDGFFALFGGEPTLGRTFRNERAAPVQGLGAMALDEASGVAPVAVISHGLWLDLLGGDDHAIGRTIDLDGAQVTVLGVMPPGWQPLTRTDLWLPLPVEPLRAAREDHFLSVHGRLGPGVDLAAARADAGAIARRLANEYPENDGWTFGISPLKQTVIGETRIRTGGVLLGAVGLLLLLSCAGVSNLLMARASSRAAEVGVRAALGAGRLRLMRQFLTESLVLGLVAAGAGIVLAALLMPALRAIAPPDTPRVDEAVLDGAVLLFSLGIALLTSLIFGFAPILHVIRHDTSGVLRIGPRGGNSGGGRLRRALVACQVAMTVALLVAVGLLGGTYLRMQGADVGLPVDTGLAVPLVLSGPRYTYEARRAAVADIRSGLAEIPGVVAVGSTNIPPFAGSNTAIDIAVEGQASSADSAPSVRWRAVGEGFFAALDATASHGRLFDRADFADGAEPVVVLGEALARRVAGHAADAVGRRIAMGWDGTNWRRVVGVVRDVEDLGVTDASPLTFYLPGEGAMPTVTFLVRLATPDIVPPVDVLREAIWAVDATLAVPAIDRLSDLVGRDIAAPLFNLVIVGVFGTVALALAVMGVYGVTWYAVSHRRHEIGIRLALGATPGGVLRPILGQSLAVSGAGVAAGAALAIGLSSYMESLLFQTASRDWRVLLGACAAAVIAAAVATWGPARRASVASPVEALRID